MKYGVIARFVESAFSNTAYGYIRKTVPDIDIAEYKKGVRKEYRSIIERTDDIGSMKDNMFVMTMYAGALFIAFYKNAKDHFDEDKLKEFVRVVTYSPLMV